MKHSRDNSEPQAIARTLANRIFPFERTDDNRVRRWIIRTVVYNYVETHNTKLCPKALYATTCSIMADEYGLNDFSDHSAIKKIHH